MFLVHRQFLVAVVLAGRKKCLGRSCKLKLHFKKSQLNESFVTSFVHEEVLKGIQQELPGNLDF